MAISNMTTNLQNGITNVPDVATDTLGSLVFPDPGRCHTWFNDFDAYNASEWIITTTGSGTAAVQNADGGILLLTNSAGATDAKFFQWATVTGAAVVETFTWEAGRGMWFKSRMKISDATKSQFVMGLQITDTTPLAVSDGLYFIKSNNSTTLSFVSAASSSTTTSTVGTLANDTYFTCGYWWNPDLGVMTVYFNDNPVVSLTSTTTFPSHTLAISFGVQNGEGVAKTMSVDYILASKDRRATIA